MTPALRDQDVDIPCGRDRRGDAGVVSDVQCQSLADVEVGQRARVTGGGHDAVSTTGELGGDCSADAAIGSGDQY